MFDIGAMAVVYRMLSKKAPSTADPSSRPLAATKWLSPVTLVAV
jgi:hypothetical protein